LNELTDSVSAAAQAMSPGVMSPWAMSQWAMSSWAMSQWEIVAVVLAVAYLVLAIRQNIWCWAAAFASTSIYLVLMYQASLLMESALQVFYLGMAVYGWYQWRHGPESDHSLPVSRWRPARHAGVIVAVLIATLISGRLLSEYSTAALPYIDSFTTWGAIVATFMVARKILENWLYWFVIDSVSIYLYVNRELYLTALLFAGYLVLIVIGYLSWRRDMQEMHAA
jgi:nicotinamide mononucleotide transporter